MVTNRDKASNVVIYGGLQTLQGLSIDIIAEGLNIAVTNKRNWSSKNKQGDEKVGPSSVFLVYSAIASSLSYLLWNHISPREMAKL